MRGWRRVLHGEQVFSWFASVAQWWYVHLCVEEVHPFLKSPILKCNADDGWWRQFTFHSKYQSDVISRQSILQVILTQTLTWHTITSSHYSTFYQSTKLLTTHDPRGPNASHHWTPHPLWKLSTSIKLVFCQSPQDDTRPPSCEILCFERQSITLDRYRALLFFPGPFQPIPSYNIIL